METKISVIRLLPGFAGAIHLAANATSGVLIVKIALVTSAFKIRDFLIFSHLTGRLLPAYPDK